jgi:hypothetical protein
VKTFFTESIVLPENKISLEHVPFVEGESVGVFLMAIKKGPSEESKLDLRGSVLNYDLPFESAGGDDWEALS